MRAGLVVTIRYAPEERRFLQKAYEQHTGVKNADNKTLKNWVETIVDAFLEDFGEDAE